MLRARIPLAVALLAATLVIPATAASAAGDPVTSTVNGATTQQSGTDPSGGTSANSTDTSGNDKSSSGGTDSSQSDTSNTGTTTSGDSNTPSLPNVGGGAGSNPFDPSTLNDIIDKVTGGAGGSGQTPDLAGALTTLQGCLSDAPSKEKPLLAGQQCFENFIATLTGDPRAKCFSENGFTLQFVEDRLMSGEPPSQQDLTDFQTKLAGLIACLNPSTPPADTSGGGGATEEAAPAPTATSDEAPAATPVSGNPNFTG